MNSQTTTSSEEEHEPDTQPGTLWVHHTARKSTASQSTQGCVKRRRVAREETKAPKPTLDDFVENFKPKTSAQEERELNKEMKPPSNDRTPLGALYDENGIHITSGIDLCDCLNKYCGGCFSNCPKCGSQKCGFECRVHRKYVYDKIELDDEYDTTIVNPVLKQ